LEWSSELLGWQHQAVNGTGTLISALPVGYVADCLRPHSSHQLFDGITALCHSFIGNSLDCFIDILVIRWIASLNASTDSDMKTNLSLLFFCAVAPFGDSVVVLSPVLNMKLCIMPTLAPASCSEKIFSLLQVCVPGIELTRTLVG
jgi:hypothetical protein